MISRFERDVVRPAVGRALVVGSHVYNGREDRRALFAQAEGWDIVAGDGVDRLVDLEEALPQGTVGTFAHVDCVSVLEHARRPWLMAQNIERLLRAGGTLFVEAPFVWRIHAYPDDYWRFTPSGVRALFEAIHWDHLTISVYDQLCERLPAEQVNGRLHFARAEVLGFGKKLPC